MKENIIIIIIQELWWRITHRMAEEVKVKINYSDNSEKLKKEIQEVVDLLVKLDGKLEKIKDIKINVEMTAREVKHKWWRFWE